MQTGRMVEWLEQSGRNHAAQDHTRQGGVEFVCHARTVLGFIVFVRIALCDLCGEYLVGVSSFCLYQFCGSCLTNFSIQFF